MVFHIQKMPRHNIAVRFYYRLKLLILSIDYTEAAELVSMIDAQSSCAAQAKALLNSIKKGMDKQYNDIIAMEKEKIRSDERIKSAQIKAIKTLLPHISNVKQSIYSFGNCKFK